MKILFISIYLLILSPVNLKSQQLPEDFSIGRLSLHGGIGYTAIKDEFISAEKYSGSSVSFLFDWTRMDYKNGFHLSFGINSSEVNNYNVSAEVTEAALNISYVYPVGNIRIFNKEVHLFLGPSPELLFHFRTQNIARGAIIDAYSAVFLFSAGARLDAIIPLSKDWLIEGNVYSSLLSLGGKFIDPRDSDNSMIKVLTIFSGLSSYFQTFIEHNLINNITVKAGYRFSIIKINAWDYFISAKDDFLLTFTYKF